MGAVDARPPKIKFCGITSLADGELARCRGRLGNRPDLLARLGAAAARSRTRPRSAPRCGGGSRWWACSSTPRSMSWRGPRRRVGLTILQLHGDEGPAFCAEAARRTGCKVIKAMRVRSGAEIQALSQFRTDYHLLDSYARGRPGGTGETFAWELAAAHRGSVPVILSGGLTPENVGDAIAAVRPIRSRRGERRRARARAQGPREAPGLRGGGAVGRRRRRSP